MFKFSLWYLRVEVDGLVIHGMEGPGETPYLSAKKVEVRVGISSFFSHATGAGLRSHIGLKLLRVERPQIHLMVDKDGKTNVPAPKHSSTSKEPAADRLLDLRAREVALVDGVALVNDRAIPFDLAARDLDVEMRYLRPTDRYGIAVGLNDLRTRWMPSLKCVRSCTSTRSWAAMRWTLKDTGIRFGRSVGAPCHGDAERTLHSRSGRAR